MKLKLCGIRRTEDLEYINEFKPDYIGFIFAPSKRQVTPEFAGELNKMLAIGIKSVGVFVNAPVDEVIKIAEISGIDAIQLHGNEGHEYISQLRSCTDKKIWKAVRVRSADDITAADRLGADLLLMDSFTEARYGGTGKTADWSLIKQIPIKTPFFLAGGINSNNIEAAVFSVNPCGIDLSSGAETDGVKDRAKISRIMKIINPYRFDS